MISSSRNYFEYLSEWNLPGATKTVRREVAIRLSDVEFVMMRQPVILTKEEEHIARTIVNAAFQVHKALGPGLLEKVYEICLAQEIRDSGLIVARQVIIPIQYKDRKFDDGLRLDLLVNDSIICEVKAVETVNPVWEAQILSQLRLSNKRIGFLINFHVPLIKQGIRRIVL